MIDSIPNGGTPFRTMRDPVRWADTLDRLAALRFPPELFEQPWMQPTCGDPHWIARDVRRRENGRWDRNPTSLPV